MALALDHETHAVLAPAQGARAARAAGSPDLLRFITCGSVDDGKSTLIGRLLYDSKSVFEDQLEALDQDSRRFGTQGEALDFALLVDGLSAEREQGITIDVAYRYFATPRRAFIVADTPGHEQYTRNMATGASTADLAVILIDARKGILPQTRRHSFIVSMLGVRSVAVAVNKMDLIDYDRAAFERICSVYRSMASDLGFADISFFPISARDGDNVAHLSPATPWHRGRALLDHLETVQIPAPQRAQDLLFPVQWINRPHQDFRGYAGWVARGAVRKGDEILVLPRGLRSSVDRIVTAEGDLDLAVEGQSVCLTLRDAIDVSRGDAIVAAAAAPTPTNRLRARLLWTGEAPLVPDRPYVIKIGTALAQARVQIEHTIDIHSFAPSPARELAMNGIALATLTLDREVVALSYSEARDLGGFILIDKRTNETSSFGLVEDEARGDAQVEAETSWRASVARLFLAGGANGGGFEQDLAVFAASVLASGLLVLALTGRPGVALLFAVADALLRPAIRALCQRIWAARARRQADELNSDGAGI